MYFSQVPDIPKRIKSARIVANLLWSQRVVSWPHLAPMVSEQITRAMHGGLQREARAPQLQQQPQLQLEPEHLLPLLLQVSTLPACPPFPGKRSLSGSY